MKHKFNLKRFFSVWVYWVFIFISIIFIWVAIHESSHAVVCSIVGGQPSLVQILPHPLLSCEGIISDGKSSISNTEYFFYASIPYILAGLVLLFLSIKETNIKIKYPLTIFLLIDVFYNYLSSLSARTDFFFIALVSKTYFLISIILVVVIALLGKKILVVDFKKFWNVFTKK